MIFFKIYKNRVNNWCEDYGTGKHLHIYIYNYGYLRNRN